MRTLGALRRPASVYPLSPPSQGVGKETCPPQSKATMSRVPCHSTGLQTASGRGPAPAWPAQKQEGLAGPGARKALDQHSLPRGGPCPADDQRLLRG